MSKVTDFQSVFGIKSEIRWARCYLNDINPRKQILDESDRQHLDAAISRLKAARDMLTEELVKSP